MKRTLLVLCALCIGIGFEGIGLEAKAGPPRGDDIDDPRIDTAHECIQDTDIVFTANPSEIDPFDSTTLSWNVAIPSRCPMQLYIVGQRANASGTMEVTPLSLENNFQMSARILGASSVIASVPVSVDRSNCVSVPRTESLVADDIRKGLAEFDEENDKVKILGTPEIIIENDLRIKTVMEVDIIGPNPTVTLSMGLTFTVQDSVIHPSYSFFEAEADTILPDDWVEDKFSEESDAILDVFKQEFNNVISPLIPEGMQLFEVSTEPGALGLTACSPPSPISRPTNRPINRPDLIIR